MKELIKKRLEEIRLLRRKRKVLPDWMVLEEEQYEEHSKRRRVSDWKKIKGQ